MVPSPWERRSFLRGMRQGGTVAREMSSGNQVRVGQWGATSRTCSSSSLSLHSVCASRLTGGNAYLRKARGQLCASASVPRGPSVREKYSWQWEDSGEANRSRQSVPCRRPSSLPGWARDGAPGPPWWTSRDRAVTFVARRAKSVAVRSSCINPGSVLPSCTCLSALAWWTCRIAMACRAEAAWPAAL